MPSRSSTPKFPNEKAISESYIQVEMPLVEFVKLTEVNARKLAWAYSRHGFLGMKALEFKEEKEDSWIYETLHGFNAFIGKNIIV